jgi:hypothetical protein
MPFLKNSMKKHFRFLLLVFVLASCKTKKTIVEQTVSKEAVVDNMAKEIIEKHYENKVDFPPAIKPIDVKKYNFPFSKNVLSFLKRLLLNNAWLILLVLRLLTIYF